MRPAALIPLALFAAAAPAAAQQPPLKPGVYFIWSPPGPKTVTPDHPDLPNNDWVRDQSHANENASRLTPGAGSTGGASASTRRPAGAPDLSWIRIATARADGQAPDLHPAGTDIVRAGRTAVLWFGNEDVTAADSVFASVQVLPLDVRDHDPVLSVAPAVRIPTGTWGSKSGLVLGTLPAGRYIARIRMVDQVRGVARQVDRRVDAR